MYRNVLQIAEKTRISDRYDLSTRDVDTIYQNYKNDPFMLIYTAFRIGYSQGSKATKKAEKRERR